jgi:putative transcriptional regulator
MAAKQAKTKRRPKPLFPPPEKPLGQRIIEGLTELHDALRSGEPLEKRFTVRRVRLITEPTKYDAKSVKKLRDSLAMSQALFASLMGVSVVLVQSWEQGVRTPGRMACRLLDEVKRNRTYWLDAVTAKTA